MLSVLRLKPLDKVILFDEAGNEYIAVIRERLPDSAELEIVKSIGSVPELPLRLALAQGILKGKKMDFLVQKCTELGVAEFIPVESERSIPRLSEKAAKKREKWQRVALEACKQCGRRSIPRLSEPLPFSDLLKRAAHLTRHAAGVVHQDVHAPRLAGRLFDERLHRLPVPDVQLPSLTPRAA